ncbi:MAG: AAA family ATPase [Candidatus Heimdallarchaeota archaeon]
MKTFEISEIELENIKTYKYEKIIFSQGNNVLIGENGAGKSTILESIYLSLREKALYLRVFISLSLVIQYQVEI